MSSAYHKNASEKLSRYHKKTCSKSVIMLYRIMLTKVGDNVSLPDSYTLLSNSNITAYIFLQEYMMTHRYKYTLDTCTLN